MVHSGGNWSSSLNDNACAELSFSALANMDTEEDLYGALVELLGVRLAYPCGTCGDQRSCVNFVGTVENLPFTVYTGNAAETDHINNIDLSNREFSYTTTTGGVTEKHDEKEGYYKAITNLIDRHNKNASMTDEQKKAEIKKLASAIAKDLTSQVFTALTQVSQNHFDRVVMNSRDPYSMLIFDYRDKTTLTTEQQALAPVISEVEGYIIILEEKTRVIEGKDIYSPEGLMIVTGTEYEKSIELTLPKITLDDLNIKGYRLGNQYNTEISYEYGEAARKKLDEAMVEYEKEMDAYQKEMEQYQMDYKLWDESATIIEEERPVYATSTSTKMVDGHMKTVIESTFSHNEIRQVKVHSTPPPTPPVEPVKPELSDFKEYAEAKITRTFHEDTLDPIDKALEKVLKARSILGAQQNRLEHAYNINRNTHENTQAAESRIRDTDISEELVKHAKNNILEQVGQAVIAQANQSNQGVIDLLR